MYDFIQMLSNAFIRIQKYTNVFKNHTNSCKNSKTHVNNYICSGYIGNQWIYWDVIHTDRILYGMNSGGICYGNFT